MNFTIQKRIVSIRASVAERKPGRPVEASQVQEISWRPYTVSTSGGFRGGARPLLSAVVKSLIVL